MPGRKFTTYIEDELVKEIKKIAVDKETSVSQILNDLIKEYIRKVNAENEVNK